MVLGDRHAPALHAHALGRRSTISQIVRVDADPDEPARVHKPDGRADRRRRADPAAADRRAAGAQSAPRRRAATRCRSARPTCARVSPSSRRSSPSSTPSAPNCRKTASSSTRSRRSASPRASPFRSTSRARFSRPATRTISAGALPPRSARSTRAATCRCVSINGDGGFMYTGERARHRDAPPHSAGRDRVHRRRLRQCAAHPGGAVRQPADRQRPRQSGLRQIRRELRRRRRRARARRRNCAPRLREAFAAATGRP